MGGAYRYRALYGQQAHIITWAGGGRKGHALKIPNKESIGSAALAQHCGAAVLTGRAAGDDSQRVCAVLPGNAVELRGREVGLEFDAAELHLFDAASGRRLAHCG